MPRIRQKQKASPAVLEMPRGFYLKRGVWYVRIHKPHPETGVWAMMPESTGCKEAQRVEAIAYRDARVKELEGAARFIRVDPRSVTVGELLDDLLQSNLKPTTRRNYEQVINAHVRPFFGSLRAVEVTVNHCREYRRFRTAQEISDVTVNRDLSKVSKAFRLGVQAGKVPGMAVGRL